MIHLLLSLLFIASSNPVDEDRAREIFEEFDNRRSAITYETGQLNMVITDHRNRTRNRTMRMYSFASENETKSLTVFEAPADVRGTGFLSLSDGNSEVQYLYLPALGRTQTIGSGQRSDRFMGSDFTFEDLGAQNPENFEFELIEEEGNQAIVRAVPTGSSQYAYIIYTLDIEKFILIEAAYFDSDENQIKELTAHDYTEVKEGIWRPNRMVMRDLKENRQTELIWTDRTFDEPIPSSYFTERHLQRGIR